ncbi:putative peptide zinc metalloprotease protein [Azospirillaceae bacterium]
MWGRENAYRWKLGSASKLLAAIATETTLETGFDELTALVQFLTRSGLLRADQPAAAQALLAESAAMKLSWLRWLLHHYLFVRIPIVRPDAFLTATLYAVRRLVQSGVISLIILLGGVGVLLALRQWDAFLYTFHHFFSPEGMLAFAIALSLVKVAHELGHAYTAKYFGCRIPTMGIALLVMCPVLYTDVSDS